MNGTSGFQEVRSSTSRSPAYRFLHEQRHQFGTGFCQFLPTHDLTVLSIGISTKREEVPDAFFGSYWEKANVAISLLAVSFMMSACTRDLPKEGSRVHADRRAAANYVADELLVQFKSGAEPARIKALNESLRVEVIKTLAGGYVNLIKIPADKSLEEIRRAYLAAPEVESVGLNYKVVGQ